MINLTEHLFEIFILVNFIVSVVYIIIGLFRKKTKRKLLFIRGVVMMLAPGVGPLLFFLSWAFYMIFFRKEVDLSDVVFSKERTREMVRTNEERERNFVSMEEAIEITDKGELRNFVMGVAQSDYSDSLAAITLALDCEDTETAHYAASVLQDALNQFRLLVQKEYKRILSVEDKESEQRVYDIKSLLEYMNRILLQHVFGDVEQKSFTDIMENLMQILFEIAPTAITSELYENLSLRLLDVEDYALCEKWCERAFERHPNTLASYTAKIKLYFNWGKKDEFFETMKQLKESPIIIDKETLELIRAFL